MKISSLGTTLTRLECDCCIKDLALILPRAGLGPDEIDRMLDLYFGLLREAGVTRPMLADACKAFIMAPRKGKPRFFPDPGELAELCADDAKDRRKSLKVLREALALFDAPPAEEKASGKPFDAGAALHDLAEKMRAKSLKQTSDPVEKTNAILPTGRLTTDANELREAINKRLPPGERVA